MLCTSTYPCWYIDVKIKFIDLMVVELRLFKKKILKKKKMKKMAKMWKDF